MRRGGRGGIRTHGGFPHARFRVECLKPDSATLPIARYCACYFSTRNCRPLSLQRLSMDSSVSVMRWTATNVQIWVRDELACAREFDLASPGWLLRNRRTSYGCFGEGGSWVGRDASGGKKCYNFRLATPSLRAAYCMSQGQPTLLLVVHKDSQVVCAAVHKYSHLIQNFNPP